MKKNFLIISDDKIVIDNKIAKIMQEIDIKNKEIVKFDMEIVTIPDVLEELNTYNFLSDCKVVICYNSTFIEKDVPKDMAKDFKKLREYIQNPSDNYLIMVAKSKSNKKEITELLTNVEIIDSGISSELLVKNNLEDFKMENSTVKYFVNYCLRNNEKILNELQKIKCYKQDENRLITVDDINKIALREYDEDIFDLVNAIARCDRKNIFAIYKRLIKKEKDCTNIIASIAALLRRLYSIKILKKQKISVNEMARMLNVKTMAISLSLENCDNFTTKKLLKLLNELSSIDYANKTTNSSYGEDNLAFELFLLSI